VRSYRDAVRSYLDAVRRDGDAMLHAAGRDPAAPVPTCPGWATTDLLAHVGRIYRYVARQARSPERVPDDSTEVPADEVAAATADALAELLVVLAELDPAAPAWNWARDEPNVAAFWPRRMALETVVHRYDAEAATGTPAPIPAELACDGVEEVLTTFLPARRGRSKEPLTGTAHLHATDAPPGAPGGRTVESEWTLEFGPAGATVLRHGHEKADAALRGPAGQLLLAVWGRPAELERFGDPEIAAAVRAQ
jgi:uncharacterized protein (TIGR03083 family)